MRFSERLHGLPHLGVGISTEYGAGGIAGALDPRTLRERHPRFAEFLEIGVDAFSGLDAFARSWVESGAPRTYHFLDLNLDDPADQDEDWLEELRRLLAWIRPAWVCGDAGLWHFGAREPGHNLLLPPILTDGSADALAEGVRMLRAASGHEVLPENPPGVVYLGDQHLLDFFARVVDRADSGMLLDCAHLAIYQKNRGFDSLTGLDGFPLERVVELHLAGGTTRRVEGFECVDDDHTPEILPETWRIFEHVIARTPNLRAVVFECERNPLAATLPVFARIRATLEALRGDTFGASDAAAAVPIPLSGAGASRCAIRDESGAAAAVLAMPDGSGLVHNPARSAAHTQLHRAAVRMYFDPGFVRRIHEDPEQELAALSPRERDWLLQADARAWRAAPKIPERCWAILEEEFAASVLVYSALAGRAETAGSAGVREMFFASESFHRSVESGGSVGTALAQFLRSRFHTLAGLPPAVAPATRAAAALVALEEAMANLRRTAPSRPPDACGPEGRLGLSPDRSLLVLPGGTVQLADDILAAAANGTEDPVTRVRAVLEQSPPDTGAEPEHILLALIRTDGDARARHVIAPIEITRDLYVLLEETGETPEAYSHWVARAVDLGASPGEARALLRDLLEDGTLTSSRA